MSEQEGIALFTMFWILVGFPVLIIGNVAIAYQSWMILGKRDE